MCSLPRAFAGLICFGVTLLVAIPAPAQRHMERLGRGLVAVNQGEGRVFVSWRLLRTDPAGIAFNVYRETSGSEPLKLNNLPLTNGTFYQDTAARLNQGTSYFVRALADGIERPTGARFVFQKDAPA